MVNSVNKSKYAKPELSPMTSHRVATAKIIGFQIIHKNNGRKIKEAITYTPNKNNSKLLVFRKSQYYIAIKNPDFRDCLGHEVKPDKNGKLPKCTIKKRKDERFVPIPANEIEKYGITRQANTWLELNTAVKEINKHREKYSEDYANTLKYA